MRRRTSIAIVTGAAILVAAAFAASGFGSPSSRPGKQQSLERHTTWGAVHASAATTSATGLQVIYVTGSTSVDPGKFFGGPLRCTKAFPHPLGGFFDSDSEKVFLSTDRPDPIGVSGQAARRWVVGVTNTDTVAAKVGAGVICAK